MRLFRRRRLPPELAPRFEAFQAVVERVERGKAVLTEAVPSTRFAGRALPDVLVEFEQELREAEAGMASWRCAPVEKAWTVSQAGMASSLALAERVRLEAPDPGGFEGLIGLIGDLLAPLEAFEDAAQAFTQLRTRVPSPASSMDRHRP